jgi:hypothetical protein
MKRQAFTTTVSSLSCRQQVQWADMSVGEYQRGTNQMDGVAMGTQCPIPSGASFTQTFKVEAEGTHWYHSRMPDLLALDGGQRLTGYRRQSTVSRRATSSNGRS